jgi:hypothetical protein
MNTCERLTLLLFFSFELAACQSLSSPVHSAPPTSESDGSYIAQRQALIASASTNGGRCASSQGIPCVLVTESDPAFAYLAAAVNSPNRDYSGVSIRVIPPTHALIGQGYSLTSGSLRGVALTPCAPNCVVSREYAVSYDLLYIDSYESLARALDISASASYSGFSGGFSASMNLFQSSNFTSTKAYILVRMRVITGTEDLTSYVLNSDALHHLGGSNETGRFSSAYGDAFIGHLVRGGELYALMEFSAEANESIQDLKVSVSGSYGGFSASAGLSDYVDHLSKYKKVRVLYAQSGGQAGRDGTLDNNGDAVSGGVLTITPTELIGRIRDFPREAKEHPEQSPILWAEVFDYSVASNAPPQLSATSKLPVWWALQDLGTTKIAVDERRNTAQSVLDDRTGYSSQDFDEAAAVARYTRFLDTQLERLAQTVLTYPSSAKGLTTPTLPSRKEYEDMYATVQSGSPTTSQLYDQCPAGWSDSVIVVTCLFGPGAYAPQPLGPPLLVLSGKTHLGGCRGDIQSAWCAHHTAALSFDPASTSAIAPVIEYQNGHGYVFSAIPVVTVDPVVSPENSIFGISVQSVSTTGFVIMVDNPLNTPNEGNHGWNGDLVVQWTAIFKPAPPH